MKKLFYTILLAAAGVMTASAQRPTAAEAFVAAPREVIALVDSMTRLDMIDYFTSGSTTPSSNKLDGDCRVTALSPESLTFKASEASEHTIVPLGKASGKDGVIMMISTFFLPAADSGLRFFSDDWSEIGGKKASAIFSRPTLTDWIKKENRGDIADIENAIPFMAAHYSYDPATEMLTVTHSLETLLSPDDYARVSDKLYPAIIYKWNGKGAFVKQKNR